MKLSHNNYDYHVIWELSTGLKFLHFGTHFEKQLSKTFFKGIRFFHKFLGDAPLLSTVKGLILFR